jgi:hypothetical protein
MATDGLKINIHNVQIRKKITYNDCDHISGFFAEELPSVCRA